RILDLPGIFLSSGRAAERFDARPLWSFAFDTCLRRITHGGVREIGLAKSTRLRTDGDFSSHSSCSAAAFLQSFQSAGTSVWSYSLAGAVLLCVTPRTCTGAIHEQTRGGAGTD